MPWLTGFHDVVDVFRSRDFVQGGGGRRDSAPMIGHGLLSLAGRDHFERRRIESVLFRRPALEHFELGVLAPALESALASRARERGMDGRVRAELFALLTEAFCPVSAAFLGIDGVDTSERRRRFLEYVDGMRPAGDIEWETRDHREVLREGLSFKEEFTQEFYSPSLERRRRLVEEWRAGQLSEAELPLDLITTMLRHEEHFAHWDDDVLLRELILFAPGATITRVVPHIVAELLDWLELHPQDRAHTTEVAYLRQVANEALRLHPPSPFFIRKAESDTWLASGRAFHAGDYVVLDVTAASRDESVFGKDADQFNPYREPLVTVKHLGIAFGDGPHTCIGMSMSVGETGTTGEDPAEPVGFVIYILRRLFGAGISRDPALRPRANDANVRNEYADFPVCLDRL
jgi:cytochrome P450